MKPRVIAFCAASAISVGLASGEQLPLKIYSTAEGLTSDRIHCILSDSHGFLWFGTEDGLSRFDGYGFRNFNESDGLPAAAVAAMIESRDGAYWLGTTRGLVRFDAAHETARSGSAFRVFHVPGGGLFDQVESLLEDRSGVLWMGTQDGLFRVERGLPEPPFERVRFLAPSVSHNVPVNALAQDREGSLWIGTEEGLYRRGPNGGTARIAEKEAALTSVRCLAIDRRGSLWVGTHGTGVFEVTSDAAGNTTMRPSFSTRNGLAGEHVTALFEASDGTLWASCYGGVTAISSDRSSARSYTTSEGLSGLGMWSLAEDRDGNLWIGSDDAGVMRLARNGFRRFDGRDGLTSVRVGALFEGRNGDVCAFTRGRRPAEIAGADGFLECFDGRRFSTQRLSLPAGALFGWGWSQVTLQDHIGEWWVPTLTGLFRFPAVPFARLGAAVPKRIYATREGLQDPRLLRLYEDRRGDLWLGLVGGNGSLARWDRRADAVRLFSAADGVPDRQPMSFAEDRGGALWIGLREGGLLRYREGAMNLFESGDGLPAGSIRSLHSDARGRLWIASGRGGVGRIDRPEDAKPRIVTFGLAQGLSSADTSSLTEDRWGRIYVGTERSLDRIDPATGNVQHFTTDDGLARGVVETSLADRDGNLWFGSVEGLSRLTPVADPRRPLPPVRIARALVNSVGQPLSGIGANRVTLSARMAEPASVQVDFVALDFAPGGRPRYQYRVDGIDRDWSTPTEQPSVVYARLPSGSYRFRVRAIANDGSIGAAEASAVFTILPSFWKRPEIAALLATLAVGIAYALHRNRLKSALAVERVRTRVAKDLHDDVGSGLSEIAILSELAGETNGRRGATDPTLQEIGDTARRLVDSMSDIVWSTDPRRDDVGSLVARIRRFAANTLESRRIAWSLEVPSGFEGQALDPERRRQIFLIVKEALTNVARHSGCARAGVRIVPGPHEVAIEIEDDGSGFSPARAGSGHGLENMRARALAVGGSFHLESSEANGTRIRFCVPLGRAMRSA